MDPELVNVIINTGGTGILIWIVWKRDNEAAEQRKQTWALLEYLIRQRDPDFSAESLSNAVGTTAP